MSDKSCKYCYYNDFCFEDGVCDNYTPVGDSAIDELIEQKREEFRNDYFKYIKDREF